MEQSSDTSPLELDRPRTTYSAPPPDRRRHVPEPPPVRLVALEEVRVPAPCGREQELDRFYISLLKFERDATSSSSSIVYKAENAKLVVELLERAPERIDLRPVMVEVPVLAQIEAQIIELEVEYQRLRGLMAAQETLLLQDPAGNWVSIAEARGIR